MALKKWMKKCQPLSLYIIMILTLFYFLLQLVVCYITHALTLTIDSYLMLCNLIALFGCIITLKSCDVKELGNNASSTASSSNSSDAEINCKGDYVQCPDQPKADLSLKQRETRLKNTFGWARIDVLVMLIGCVVFASLCFSTIIEAVQTLFHISHHDQMHHPIPVFCVAAFGLLLNGLCYFLIGGYTFHHGSCLRITPSGAVVLDKVISASDQREMNLRMNCRDAAGPWEMIRDVLGSILVMICSVVVHFNGDNDISRLADPVFSIISALFLTILSFPYLKESCCILLQTIPNHINIESMCKQLIKQYPDVLNVHDLHVWQLSRNQTFFTAHIIFLNPQVYAKITTQITNFFREQGISTVTIQPEFFKDTNCLELISSVNGNCLVKCFTPECYQRYCCDLIDPEELKSVCVAQPAGHVTTTSCDAEKIDSRQLTSGNGDAPQTEDGKYSNTQVEEAVAAQNSEQLTEPDTSSATTAPEIAAE